MNENIPVEIQVFLWNAIDSMPEPKDYLQVFRLSEKEHKQHILHESEEPEYKAEYDISPVKEVLNEKIFVIDDGEQCTMLLAEEY